MWDPSVLPVQAKFPLSTPEHQPQFCLYPNSWLMLAVFQEFWLNEALTSLLVIPVEACYHLQKIFSWPLWTASCWIADLRCLGLPLVGTSRKRWWACIEQFEDMCWGILGTPISPGLGPHVWLQGNRELLCPMLRKAKQAGYMGYRCTNNKHHSFSHNRNQTFAKAASATNEHSP